MARVSCGMARVSSLSLLIGSFQQARRRDVPSSIYEPDLAMQCNAAKTFGSAVQGCLSLCSAMLLPFPMEVVPHIVRLGFLFFGCTPSSFLPSFLPPPSFSSYIVSNYIALHHRATATATNIDNNSGSNNDNSINSNSIDNQQ